MALKESMSKEVRIQIEGMHCAACVRRVTAALEKVAEVKAVEVGTAVVRTDGNGQAAVDAVNRIGFKATVPPQV